MRTQRAATIHELRTAIDCLPQHTKVAMLEGIRSNPIIVGAYTDGEGICPMLAAHRAGGRTSFISFARAWDRFAFRGARVKRARRATERELLILRTHLEASLLAEEPVAADLAAALAHHRELLARHAASRAAQPSEPTREAAVRSTHDERDRSRELRRRPGWAWMRIVRRYDDYERALRRIEREGWGEPEREGWGEPEHEGWGEPEHAAAPARGVTAEDELIAR